MQLTGHAKVDAIASITFEGDVTPRSWYKHIVYQTRDGGKKVDRLAIDLLADIIYWYRPYQKRHELTGEVIGWKKKFADNVLRRSPDAFAESVNATVRCVRESIKLLEGLGLINVILKPVRTAYGVIPNVMHIDINPEAIANITYRSIPSQCAETIEKSLLTKWVTSNDETVTNPLRNRNQPVTNSSEVVNETVNSSIYRDFTDISPDISEEISALPPNNTKVALDVEVLEPEPEVSTPSLSLATQLTRVESKNDDFGFDKSSAEPHDESDQIDANLLKEIEQIAYNWSSRPWRIDSAKFKPEMLKAVYKANPGWYSVDGTAIPNEKKICDRLGNLERQLKQFNGTAVKAYYELMRYWRLASALDHPIAQMSPKEVQYQAMLQRLQNKYSQEPES